MLKLVCDPVKPAATNHPARPGDAAENVATAGESARLRFPAEAWRAALSRRPARTAEGLRELTESVDKTLARMQAGIDALSAEVESYKFPGSAAEPQDGPRPPTHPPTPPSPAPGRRGPSAPPRPAA